MTELWRRLDPPDWVANEQQSWDKNYRAWCLHQAGCTLEQIARDMGVTRERIRQRESKYLRTRDKGLHSPIENWLNGWRDEIGKVFGHRPYSPPATLDAKEIVKRARDVVRRAKKEQERERLIKQREAEEKRAAGAFKARRMMMEYEGVWRLEEMLQGKVRDNLFSNYTTPELEEILRKIEKLGKK